MSNTLEDILETWAEDAKIDQNNLSGESLRISELHHKYFSKLSRERLRLMKMKEELKSFELEKREFYSGNNTDEHHKMGWELPPRGSIKLKEDLPRWVEADRDVVNEKLKIAYQAEKVELLESIIKTIQNRGFHINAAIQWEKFRNGEF